VSFPASMRLVGGGMATTEGAVLAATLAAALGLADPPPADWHPARSTAAIATAR